ncbi:MAG: hypothetical protein F4238_13845 [Gemmatimonadetes bacterium]|nr:hypothetical protein [Gemmatimonadota bacterium]
MPRRIALVAVLASIAAGISASHASIPAEPLPAQPSPASGSGSRGTAPTNGVAAVSETYESHDNSAPPRRCAEGDEPRVTPPDVTAPPAPFRGIVSIGSDYDPDSGAETLIIGYHNTSDRTNTEFMVEGIETGGPISVRADARGLLIERGGGAFSFADSCSLEPAERYQHFTISGAGEDPVGRGYYARIVVPWGGAPRIDGIRLDSDEDSTGFTSTEPYTFATNNGLGGGLFDIGTHANGIHIVAADQVGAYVITRYGDEAPPEDLGLYGDDRSWSINDDVFLLGTDGELLAFGIWPFEPAWAPPEITVMSMRTGEVVACGSSWHWLGLLLISPLDEGLLVSDITLPPSGWLNPPDSCPRGIGADLLEYLASQPVPDPPAAVRAPRPVSLPSTPAPAAPFQGIVRSFTRYDPANYDHDHIVQYYDSRSGEVTEVAFDDIGTGRFSRGFEKRLAVAPDGVVVGRRGSVLLMIPWGAAPEMIHAQLQVPHPDGAGPGLVLGDGVDDPSRPFATECETATLEVRDETLRARLRLADYGDEWDRLRLLELSYGDKRERFLLAAPVETLTGEVEVSTICSDDGWFEDEYHTPRLRGTDGTVLVLSYQYVPRDPFFGVPGDELALLVSLDTGEVLACGIEPRYSEMVFVTDDPPNEPERPTVLPASGWLDPRPCVDDPSARLLDCNSIFWRSGDQRTCARELDFRMIGENAESISTTPATITVVAELDRFE